MNKIKKKLIKWLGGLIPEDIATVIAKNNIERDEITFEKFMCSSFAETITELQEKRQLMYDEIMKSHDFLNFFQEDYMRLPNGHRLNVSIWVGVKNDGVTINDLRKVKERLKNREF